MKDVQTKQEEKREFAIDMGQRERVRLAVLKDAKTMQEEKEFV